MTSVPEHDSEATPRFPIRVAARRAGLTPTTVRAWERRYAVVDPARTDSGQRLYSESEVRRLRTLHELTERGWTISQLAALSEDELRAAALGLSVSDGSEPPPSSSPGEGFGAGRTLGRREGEEGRGGEGTVADAFRAVRDMEARELERILRRASLEMGPLPVVEGVMVPLLARIGSEWREGKLGPAQEHLASGVIRRILDWLLETLNPRTGPLLVLATPQGQVHEFGVLLAGVVAAGSGWRVTYLGADLPPEEIVRGGVGLGAGAVALSILRPELEPDPVAQVSEVRTGLPLEVSLMVGGVGMEARGFPPGVEVFSRFRSFREALEACFT